MKSSEYRAILGRLPIEHPTPQDMAMLCPHLTLEEAVEAFTTGDSGHVACPPLRVRHGFQIVSYDKGWVEQTEVWRTGYNGKRTSVTETKIHPPRLRWSYAGRTPKSYADGKSRGDVSSSFYKHTDKAMEFAEGNWGDELILDDWVSVTQLHLSDPRVVLYLTLGRDLNAIINEYDRPLSEIIDEAILQMTLDPVISHELRGARGGTCSDDQRRLSRKMATYLRENGFEFKVDPEIAWKEERQKWERYGHKPGETICCGTSPRINRLPYRKN